MIINRKNQLIGCFLLIATSGLSGCATITSDSMQAITVDARDQNNKPVKGVTCKLVNDKGTWHAKAPETVMVHKSASDLHVVAEKEGLPTGTLKVVSKANAGLAGNIIFGGVVGAAIDHTKGTAYNYPSNVTIVMGQSKTIPERKGRAKRS